MHTVSRLFEFDAGHRILGHEGRCRWLHGHRYRAEVVVTAPLDQLDMVLDYAVLKEKVGGWIYENWDHNFLAHADDGLLRYYLDTSKPTRLSDDDICRRQYEMDAIFAGRDPYLMKYGNPTAENVARELFEVAQTLLDPTYHVVEVVIHETPNVSARYSQE